MAKKQPEYNISLTTEAFSDEFCRAHKAHVLFDSQEKILGSVSGEGVFDLNGKMIAAIKREETHEDENGNKTHEAVYESDARSFVLRSDDLYSQDGGNSVWVGRLERKKRNPVHIAILSVIAAILITTIILLALIGMPADRPEPENLERPIIDISDSNGSWEAQGVIAVFDDGIRPGSRGEYGFMLRNPNISEMQYEFYIEPRYEGAEIDYFPLQFRLKMNNVLLESKEWKTVDKLRFSSIDIMGGTTHTFTLEWRWAFEGGNDAQDTLIGADGGKISMVLHLSATPK